MGKTLDYNSSLFDQFNRDMDRLDWDWNRRHPMDRKGRRRLFRRRKKRGRQNTG